MDIFHRFYTTIDLYSDGVISKAQTVEVVNRMKYSDQVMFKNDIAIKKALVFQEAKELKIMILSYLGTEFFDILID